MDIINEYLKKNSKSHNTPWGETVFEVTPRAVCKDGYSVSIQANDHTYSKPRKDGAWPYESVELGFPNQPDELINEYAEDSSDYTETVYG